MPHQNLSTISCDKGKVLYAFLPLLDLKGLLQKPQICCQAVLDNITKIFYNACVLQNMLGRHEFIG